MYYSAVIFDLDGTLLNTLEDLAHAGNHVLKKRGFSIHSVEEYKYFVGDGLSTLIKKIMPTSAYHAEYDKCFQDFKGYYSEHWHDKTLPYEGIQELLTKLKQADRRLAILSNKPHDFTLKCVGHFFGDDYFEQVFGQRDTVAKKPDPAGALEIAKLMGVKADNCVYVGDTKVDMKTGKAAGMYTIGVLWGFRDAAELHENGADLLVDTPEKLASSLLNL